MTRPRLPDPFRWLDSVRGPVLECAPLARVAAHVFTTRTLRLSSPDAWDEAAALVGVGRVEMVRQVHGREVVVIRRGALPWTEPPRADALASDEPGSAIGVRAADCVPILLADPVTGAAAAVHAGWRGTAAGVAPAAVEALTREFGARPADLVAAIGPAIRSCCYAVGSELVDAFAAAGHARHLVDRWFSLRDPDSGVRDGDSGLARAGRLVLDVPGANRDQLVLAGVREAQIHDCGLCTAEHLDVFTSYRAELEKAGRLAAIIRPRPG